MKVKFWGTRGSIASPGAYTIKYGGNTTCIALIPADDEFNPLIVDAGTGIRLLGRELEAANKPLDLKILFTHSHWDHIQGMPFFGPANRQGNKLTFYGCPKLGGVMKESILYQMDNRNFPISYNSLKADIQFEVVCEDTSLLGMEIETLKLNHPGSGLGYRFTNQTGSVVLITDHELEEKPYIGASLEETAEFCREADILIHDAQYRREEMDRFREWGHSAIEDAFEMAVEAEAGKLVLFHHDPNRADDEIAEIVKNLREKAKEAGSKIKVFAAREGMEMEVTG